MWFLWLKLVNGVIVFYFVRLFVSLLVFFQFMK